MNAACMGVFPRVLKNEGSLARWQPKKRIHFMTILGTGVFQQLSHACEFKPTRMIFVFRVSTIPRDANSPR